MTEQTYLLAMGTGWHSHAVGRLVPEALGSEEDIRRVLPSRRRSSLWIAPTQESVISLARALCQHHSPHHDDLLALVPVPPPLCHLFSQRFRRFVDKQESMLPLEEIVTVLIRKDRADFCIGGTVDMDAGMLRVVRGDLSNLWIPLSSLRGRETGPRFDPTRFRIVDHGRTLQLGEFQAAFDALLYELDPNYRKRLKNLRTQQDRTLAGSLRRLRKQRGFRLRDMGALEKAMARIERGEVTKPHRATLTAIAHQLGVLPGQLGDF
jgi:hypothetical protein